VFSLFAIVTVVSTLAEVLSTKFERRFDNKYTIFSLLSNYKHLNETKQSKSSINCIDAIKVLSMIWIILGHRGDGIDRISPQSIVGEYLILTIRGYYVAVDTFLVCSAILVTQSILKALDRFEFLH
jgi:hypothetical protein